MQVSVLERTFGGDSTDRYLVQLADSRMKVKDLIRACIDDRVASLKVDAADTGGRVFFAQPETEALLNGRRQPKESRIETQYERAYSAFTANQILLLVDEQQYTDLDEEVVIRPQSSITFLRLMPLVGG